MTSREEAELLCRENLPIPAGLDMFIFDKTDYRINGTVRVARYVSTIQFWHGRLIQRVFGFKAASKKRGFSDMQIREVCRYMEGFSKCLLRDVVSNMYSGHQVEFDEDWQSEHFYIHEGTPWNFFGYIMYDEKEWIQRLNIPYCQYHNKLNQSRMSFFRYICLYRQEPKIELLVKAGLSQYISGLRYLDLKQKSLDKIFKVDKKFVPMLKDMDVKYLLLARKYPWANSVDELFYIHHDLEYFKHIRKHLTKRSFDYVKKLTHSLIVNYNDYLRFADEMGMDLNNPKVLCPDNLTEAHNNAAQQIYVFRNKEKDESIKAFAEKLHKYDFCNGVYEIFPAESTEELVNESKVLHHCVRTYAGRVANGETAIFFVRTHEHPEVPLYTLELRGKRVVQVRGNHNSPPAAEAKAFIHQWMSDVVKNPDGYGG